ncbi:helix-turn-helix domain-containing protein [Halostagnicola bangensis]
MGLTAEFRLLSEEMELVDVVRAVPDCTLIIEHDEQTVSGPVVRVIRVTCGSFDAFEAALEDAANVEGFTLISDVDQVRSYHVVMDGPFEKEVDELTLNKTLIERQRVGPDGYYLKHQFANREELAAYRDSCVSMGVEFRLDRLYEADKNTGWVPGVSEKQREALLAAYELGYFDVPRRAPLEEVATSLEISRSALAERLHRGQAHLIEHYFYDDLY